MVQTQYKAQYRKHVVWGKQSRKDTFGENNNVTIPYPRLDGQFLYKSTLTADKLKKEFKSWDHCSNPCPRG